MSSRETARIGAQRPQRSVRPREAAWTDGPDAAALMAEYAHEPDPWQEAVLDDMLARDERDAPLYLTLGLSAPRQNGKNGAVEGYELYKLVACHENVLHTAHLVSTAKKSFERLARIFSDPRNDDLGDLVASIRRTNGEQGIYLRGVDEDGEPWESCIEYSSRSRGGARGSTYSAVVFDEAQELTDEQVEAIMPTLAASPTGYRQLIYLGTPPGPTCPGTVFANVRASALSDAPPETMCWYEWGVSSLPERGSSFDDLVDLVYETNPAMGIRLDVDFAANEFATMTLDGFARERLGWWAERRGANSVIGATLWAKSAIGAIGDKYRRKKSFGVKFSPDGSYYALAGCKSDAKGRAAVELVEIGSTAGGVRALAQRLHDARTSACVVVIDGQGGADALCDNLAELGAPRGYVVRPRVAQVCAASSVLLSALDDGTCAHTSTPALDDSALHAVKRPIGNRGGWGFGSDGAHDPAPIEAAALAHWGLRNTRRDPKRKQRLL